MTIASQLVSVSDFRQNINKYAKTVHQRSFYVLSNNKPIFKVVPIETEEDFSYVFDTPISAHSLLQELKMVDD